MHAPAQCFTEDRPTPIDLAQAGVAAALGDGGQAIEPLDIVEFLGQCLCRKGLDAHVGPGKKSIDRLDGACSAPTVVLGEFFCFMGPRTVYYCTGNTLPMSSMSSPRPVRTLLTLSTAAGSFWAEAEVFRFDHLNAASGKVLWELPLNSQPGGFPMTYMAGGKQYVAIPTGLSLIGNRVVRSLTPEIPVPSRGSTLLVFALPDPDSSVTGLVSFYHCIWMVSFGTASALNR